MSREKANIWWNQVPAACQLADETAAHILKGEPVYLLHAECLPWPETFQEEVRERCEKAGCTLRFTGSEPLNRAESAGQWVYETFSHGSRRYAYRKGMDYGDFMAESPGIGLYETLLWTDLCEDKARLLQWQTFIETYRIRRENQPAARFVVAVPGNLSASVPERTGSVKLDLYQMLDSFSLLTFAMLLLPETVPSSLRGYTAELAALFAGRNAEFAAALLQDPEALLDNPLVWLRRKAAEGGFSLTAEPEPLLLRAQLRHVFPAIEIFRSWLVERYRFQLNEVLRQPELFAEPPEDIHELEIGGLQYLGETGRVFYGRDEYRLLTRSRRARNLLAHLQTVHPGRVIEILTNTETIVERGGNFRFYAPPERLQA